ncbi:phosphoribosyltransferase [Desulfurobacterium atlanticum]|uniref:Predicted phosphoribosyltransferase n=1 Tax=Desulfurobacterium atlanticum TaxID=240169 RepID=A0A238ZBC3_9BACT|nr:phosphoribosyltransferase family protein [Desulfurobacterium atlanticum]SNR80221.1 Predicted phosphoribosyltransferase [Desulfurobacterium atlanticum]
MVFTDRKEAGKLLAEAIINKYDGTLVSPVVVAIPRGGVVVAEPVAEALNAPLTLIFPRKIGAPFNEEYAIGAVTESGFVLLNPDITDDVAARLGITREYIEKKAFEEMEEIKRRKEKFRVSDINMKDRDVILVDDGIATGLTVKAAIMELKNKKPRRIILAIPVMPAEKVDEFRSIVDDLIVLYPAPFFRAVGQFYSQFPQTDDSEVIEILEKFKGK